MFSKPLSLSTKPETNTSLVQSGSHVSPCFELKNNFPERCEKPLTLASSRKRQNHNLDKKMAEANEEKAVSPSPTAEEAPVSIVTYTEDEMAAFKENMTSKNAKKSTTTVQH